MANELDYRRIGAGFCGSVWFSNDPKFYAMKREDGGPGRSLLKDYNNHQKLLETMFESQGSINSTIINSPRVCLPFCYQYVHNDDQTWWDKHIARFPADFQIPCNILVTDRIPPVAEEVRNMIIDKYCPESLKSSIKTSIPDQDCLIRPYLGRRRRRVKQSRFQAFSLRNYPLHVDQMEELGLDMIPYAEIMAETLAHVYWRAHLDANDVEFVLAPPSPKSSGRVSSSSTNAAIIDSGILGTHAMWMLDFDCCRHMSFDEDGVDQAVNAFYRNDPFYPRPGGDDGRDRSLWNAFRNRFLEVSEGLLGRQSAKAHLPVVWVDTIEARGRY